MSRFAKILLILFIVNTALFALARLIDLSIWWVVVTEALIIFIFLMVKVMASDARRLQKQATAMGWEFLDMQIDPKTGFRDAIYEREGLVAKISWNKGTISLLGSGKEFDDFRDLERNLITSGGAGNGCTKNT